MDSNPMTDAKAWPCTLTIVRDYLIAHDHDGLFNRDAECACLRDDLAPCGAIGGDCELGQRVPCDCGDHDWHIERKEPTP